MNKSKIIQTKKISELLDQPNDVKVNLLQHATQLAIMLVYEMLSDSVNQITGSRYSHGETNKPIVRHGFNPGSVKIQEKKYHIEVPRIRERASNKCVPLPIWQTIKESSGMDESLLQRLILGISTRDYEKTIQEVGEGFGVSKSSISKQFIEQATEKMKEFQNRSLKDHKYVVIMIDGKYIQKNQVVVAMGITDQGEKQILDLVQTETENTRVIRQLLVRLNQRGLDYSEGLLFIIDGSKGIRSAIDIVYGHKAIVQRCTWHKQENVVSYLHDDQKAEYRNKLQASYREPNFIKAHNNLKEIVEKLDIINPSAANSLREGMEETLTLQKLQVTYFFRQSLGTTNCIENVNRLTQQRLGRIKKWVNGKQILRWFIIAYLDIETRLRKINNYKKIPLLQQRLKFITKTKKVYQLFLFEDDYINSIPKMSTKKRA